MTLISRILTVLALVGLLTIVNPPAWTEAQAQIPSKVECDGCANDVVGPIIRKKKKIKGKDIAKGAVGFKQLDREVRDKIQDNMMGANRMSFYREINANATRDILAFGTFVLFAQCVLNQGAGAQLLFGIRSTRNNWLHPFSPTTLLAAAQTIILFDIATSGGALFYGTAERPGGIGPTGTLLGLIYIGLILNAFNNACIVHGWADVGQVE